MKKLTLFAIAVMFSACAMPQGGMKKSGGGLLAKPVQQESLQYVDEVVEVVTEPAGAAVNINGVFAGNAPVSLSVRRYWRGQPGNLVLDPVKVEALASEQGQCTQSGVYGQGSAKAPSPVRLLMTNCDVPPASNRPRAK